MEALRDGNGAVVPIMVDSVVLSGAITGRPGYVGEFLRWEYWARGAGIASVFNPARLPDGWEYEEYMEVCFMMIRRREGLLQLPGWRESPGAVREWHYAQALGKVIIDLEVRV